MRNTFFLVVRVENAAPVALNHPIVSMVDNYGQLSYYLGMIIPKRFKKTRSPNPEKIERNIEIYEKNKSGFSYTMLAREYNVSHSRIGSIVRRYREDLKTAS